MKTSIMTFLLLLITITNSCVDEKVDNTGYAIYKTRVDYFENIAIYMEGDKVVGVPGLTDVLSCVNADSNCIIKARLVNGYIMQKPVLFGKTVYLDMTYKDFIKWCGKYDISVMLNDTAKAHILDQNPFSEIYVEKSSTYRPFNLNDTVELNTIIIEGNLSTYFNKIK